MIENSNSAVASSQQRYRRAKEIIPGGTQLLSKRPELYAPDQWPPYYRSASGCHIVDLDGNTFLDMSSMGIGTCLLGYADADVTAAVVERVRNGSMSTLNPPDEVRLAEMLIELHPWAQQVRFARTGGEAMTVAIRLARAATGRDLVAFCGYHGWHDWYLAANRCAGGPEDNLQGHLLPGLSPNGVPSQLAGTALPFAYNNLESLDKIIRDCGRNLAAIVLEPTRNFNPQPGFLEGVRERSDSTGAVLVVDEITVGWRLALGGAHLRYGLHPDIAVYAKTLGNGHPMAAIVGRAHVMQAAQDSFISSTYWTEGVGPAAALATVQKMRTHDVPSHLDRIGRQLQEGLQHTAKRHGVPLRVSGHPALTSLIFEHPSAAAIQTLFTVRMLQQGILAASGFYPCLVHQSHHVETYLSAADKILAEIREAIREDTIEKRIGGPVKHSGFSRLA